MDFVRFDEQDPGMIQRLIQVNVEVPLQMTRYVLPQMIERRHGRIVNIGSMFGSIGFSCFTAYSASKFALRGFARDVFFGCVYASSKSNSDRSFQIESDDLTPTLHKSPLPPEGVAKDIRATVGCAVRTIPNK